jgi:hypothetical protein
MLLFFVEIEKGVGYQRELARSFKYHEKWENEVGQKVHAPT